MQEGGRGGKKGRRKERRETKPFTISIDKNKCSAPSVKLFCSYMYVHYNRCSRRKALAFLTSGQPSLISERSKIATLCSMLVACSDC